MWPFSRKPKPQPTKGTAMQGTGMRCESCDARAVFHLTWAEARRCNCEKHLCENHTRNILTTYQPKAPVSDTPLAILNHATEYELDLLVISEINDQQVVYLREVGGERYFPMLIGIFEATTLDRHLKGFQSPRPLTHDATATILTTLGAEVQYVLLDKFIENYWASQLCMMQNGRRLTVDLRPSDAFVLALIFAKPILLANELLDKVSRIDS
jgi:hypothetical protein